MKKALLLLLVLIGISTSFLACHQGTTRSQTAAPLSEPLRDTQSHALDQTQIVLIKNMFLYWGTMDLARVSVDTLFTVGSIKHGVGLLFRQEEQGHNSSYTLHLDEVPLHDPAAILIMKKKLKEGASYVNYSVLYAPRAKQYNLVAPYHVMYNADNNVIYPTQQPGQEAWYPSNTADMMAQPFRGTPHGTPIKSDANPITSADTVEMVAYRLGQKADTIFRFHARGTVQPVPIPLRKMLLPPWEQQFSTLEKSYVLKIPSELFPYSDEFSGATVYRVKNGKLTDQAVAVVSFRVLVRITDQNQNQYENCGLLIEHLY